MGWHYGMEQIHKHDIHFWRSHPQPYTDTSKLSSHFPECEIHVPVNDKGSESFPVDIFGYN